MCALNPSMQRLAPGLQLYVVPVTKKNFVAPDAKEDVVFCLDLMLSLRALGFSAPIVGIISGMHVYHLSGFSSLDACRPISAREYESSNGPANFSTAPSRN